MDSDAAAGEGAIHQRLGGRSRPLQRAGAHVYRLRRRASGLQQAELAVMLAFRTPFVDHGGIAMAGELPSWVVHWSTVGRWRPQWLPGCRPSADEYRGG